jgi:[acyl-carrier-protein] S-malonyltransferase
VLVVLAPGQGAQSPGMLSPWLDLPGAADRLQEWSDHCHLDLRTLGTTGGAAEVRDTAVAQPLLTAAALLTARALLDGEQPDVVCGHSVGELPALAVAGVLTDLEAMTLAAERGAAMAQSAAERPTGMAAVLGGTLADVQDAARRHGLQLATVNGDGQAVVGGPAEHLRALAAAPPVGTRVRALAVAGAFHTQAMLSAVGRVAAVTHSLRPADPRCTVLANADGAVVDRGPDLLRRLVAQITGPVRFDLCVQRMAALGATAVVELAPGGTLAGIVRRALPGVPVIALRSPSDLPAARALLVERVPAGRGA